MQHREGRFSDSAGRKLYYQCWHPEQNPRALILVAHGAAEHSGRYQPFADTLCQRGYAVAAIDLPGHGRSDGTRVCVRRFGDYLQSLEQFQRLVTDAFPGIPMILLGHSMGGLIAANYLLRQQQDFIACVLSGPAIMTGIEPGVLQTLLIRLLARLAPTTGVLQLDANGVSRDPQEVRRYLEDPLIYHGKLTAGLVKALSDAMGTIRQRAGEISLPMLLLHGGQDSMTAPAGSRFLFEHIASTRKELKIYPGLYHEIFNEPEREAVLTDVQDWCDAILESET